MLNNKLCWTFLTFRSCPLPIIPFFPSRAKEIKKPKKDNAWSQVNFSTKSLTFRAWYVLQTYVLPKKCSEKQKLLKVARTAKKCSCVPKTQKVTQQLPGTIEKGLPVKSLDDHRQTRLCRSSLDFEFARVSRECMKIHNTYVLNSIFWQNRNRNDSPCVHCVFKFASRATWKPFYRRLRFFC